MKQVCLLCDRTALDSNLYCQETFCPAEMCPNILDYGEWLGDIEIIKPIIVLRSSTLYEARHQKKSVLLKVAHPGQENTERLKREAVFLKDIQLKKEQDKNLPMLLPPYANTTINTDPYGRAMLKNHLLYFCLFKHFEGEPLRDILTKNSQLWINHIGWIMVSLASSMAFLQSKGMLHLGLSPETVLVRFDGEPSVPHILLFDLGITSNHQQLRSSWYPFFVPPAYTAPELIATQAPHPTYATDVYGLGLTLYEMLVGQPTFPFKLRSDEEVYNAIRENRRVRMNRVEDVKQVADIAVKAVDRDIAVRQQDAATVAGEFLKIFRDVPPQKKNRWPSLRVTLVVVAALLAIAFIITLTITMQQLNIV